MPMELLKWLWEQPLAYFPNSLRNSIVQCFMIVLLFVDRLLSLVSTEFARLFGLRQPCLLCTPRLPADLYYNDSICDPHKRHVSSLGFCAVHSKLSDIRSMCHVCIVSFATDKDSDCDKYKAVASILNKDIDRVLDDDRRAALLRRLKKDDDDPNLWCSCCGEPLKLRASKKFLRSLSTMTPRVSSPRLSWLPKKNDETPRSRYLELDAPKNDAAALTPFLQDDPSKTPKWQMSRSSKKLNFDKVDAPVEPLDIISPLNEADSDVLSRLKQQANLDHDSLMALYTELDNERSAAAVAANNAMAMITRVQQEKAAIQMEALQYQRMMEEQAEYDEEALDLMRDMLITKEDDVKALESELEAYRAKYGPIRKYGSDACEFDTDEDFTEMKSHSSCLSEKLSDYHSLNGGDQKECEDPSQCHMEGESSFDFEGERSYLLRLLTDLEKKMRSDDEDRESSFSAEAIKNDDQDRGMCISKIYFPFCLCHFHWL